MTKRAALVFIAACSAPAPPPAPRPIVWNWTPPPIDAAIEARPPAIGEACHDTCDPHACLPWAGGYCSERCDSCDGTCVATPRLGDVCGKTCAADADCRWDEGYVCDATWHACLLPNTAAIVPKRCPGNGAPHDDSFATPERLFDMPLHSPAAVVTPDGVRMAAIEATGIALESTVGLVERGAGREVSLARDGDNLIAVWARDVERPLIEVEVRSTDGRGIRGVAGGAIEGNDCDADRSCPARPRLAVTGKTHAIYLAYSGDDIGTRVRVSHDGTSFGEAVTALTGARGDIATSEDGRVHVIAMRGGLGGAYGAAQHVLEYAVSTDGAKTFGKPVAISARDEMIPAFFANPSLAVDDKRGWIYAVYVRGGTDAVWDVVIAASKDKGATWTRTVIGDGCSIHMVPSIAVDPTTGTLHLTYYDTHAEIGRYVHAACGAGATKCVDKGAIERTPFASLGTGRLDATWIGDREALVVDDKKRELHAVWTQPIDGGTAVFHAVAKLPGRP